MIGSVNVLAISEHNDVCDLIQGSLESEGHKAICVSSPIEALQLLHRGLVANFLLIHAAKNDPKDSLFAPALLQNINSEKLCILSEAGDSSWTSFAAKWNIRNVLTMPLMRHDLANLTAKFSIETATPTGSMPPT